MNDCKSDSDLSARKKVVIGSVLNAILGLMDDLLSSPGMIAATMVVGVVQILSLLLLWLNVHLFRKQSAKYKALLKSLGNEDAWGSPGWFLIPLYILSTCVASVVIVILFVFQPHFL